MAVIVRNDGSKRFCKVVACDDDGALRNGEEVGKSYVVKLENDEKTNKGITRVERAENIGKISPATLEEEHVLDEICRTEAAIALKNMGNDALNMSLYDLAIAKYGKALQYIEDLVSEESQDLQTSKTQSEFVKININMAFAHLKSQRYQQCIVACERALKIDQNNTKALYRAGIAYRSLQKMEEAKFFFLQVFRQRPSDEVVKRELSQCYNKAHEMVRDVNAVLDSLPPDVLRTLRDPHPPSKTDYKSGLEDWVNFNQTSLNRDTLNINNTKTFNFLKLLADKDNVMDAQYNIGCYYAEGKGVDVNQTQARFYFRKAAEQGHARAQVNLAIYLSGKGKGGPPNVTEAALWYEKAAQQDDMRAQRMLGVCYMEGVGVDKDPYMAVKWYAKAARQNDTKAQYNLAIAYMDGVGVVKDEHKAAKWFWRAANLGDAQAMYNLGCLYAEGVGVARDTSKASRWFAEAASRGFSTEINDSKMPPPRALEAGKVNSSSSPPSKQNISVEEQRLFPGPSGLVKEFKEEAPVPAQAKVPSTILEKIPKYLKPKDSEQVTPQSCVSNSSASAPAMNKPPSQGKEVLVGAEPLMQKAVCGLRVRLAASCLGSGIKGEKGCGTIQWVGNGGKVCHVRWDENEAFDYSYSVGHNGFYDLQAVQDPRSVKKEPTKASSWTTQGVLQFLESFRPTFGEKTDMYKESMAKEDIDGKALLQLQSEDLKELKFSLGHRKHLLEELDKLKRLEQMEDGPSRPAFSGIVVEKDLAKDPPPNEEAEKPKRDEDSILTEKFSSHGPPRLAELDFKRQAQACAAALGNVKPLPQFAVDDELLEGEETSPSGDSLFRRTLRKRQQEY
uniref:SAM domain-containing protein n=1 Tax=Guillardia theta TaxID=55529 RepID=A0A7S4JQT6_GUITH